MCMRHFSSDSQQSRTIFELESFQNQLNSFQFGKMADAGGYPNPGGKKLTLGYWKIRGLAAPARMMLHYANIDFDEVEYTQKLKEDGSVWREWQDEPTGKAALKEKNPYANLPWVEYNGQLVTLSNPVILFIGRLTKLNGSSEVEIQKNEQTLFQIWDLRSAAIQVVYAPKEAAKEDPHFSDTVNLHYTKFENWLKFHGTHFFSTDTPLSADFHVFELLDQHEGWAAQIKKESPLTNYPKLTEFYNRMLSLDELKSYFESNSSKL